MARKQSPSLGFRDIAAHVTAGTIPPVVLLFGEEQYLVRWAAGVWLLARHGDGNALVVSLFAVVSAWVWALVKRLQ